MDPLTLAIIFSVVVIGGTYILFARLSKSTIKKMNLRLQELADELDLEYEGVSHSKLSAFYTAEVQGPVEGRAFYFSHYTRSDKKTKAYKTEFYWQCDRKLTEKRLIISKEGFISSFQKQLGIQDIEVGHTEFDQLFLIKSDDEAFAKQILQEELIDEILRWDRQWYGSFIIHHQEVRYEEGGVMVEPRDKDRLLSLIKLGKYIAQKVEKYESAYK